MAKLLIICAAVFGMAGYQLTAYDNFQKWKAHDFECRVKQISLADCESMWEAGQ